MMVTFRTRTDVVSGGSQAHEKIKSRKLFWPFWIKMCHINKVFQHIFLAHVPPSRNSWAGIQKRQVFTAFCRANEDTDGSDLDADDLEAMRKRNLRREKAREMDKFCRKLKAQPSFRKACRPGVPDHNTYMVPSVDQISSQHGIVLSQERKQREVVVNSTRLSITFYSVNLTPEGLRFPH